MTEEAIAIIKQIEQLCYELKKIGFEYQICFSTGSPQDGSISMVNFAYIKGPTEVYCRNFNLCEMYQRICKENPDTVMSFEHFADCIKESLIKFAEEEYFSGKFREKSP